MSSMGSKYVKLNFRPGFHRETTRYAEEGSWYDGDRVRFRAGRPENLRGYSQLSTTSFLGNARDLLTWSDNSTLRHMVFGTDKKLYTYYTDDVIYDITPIITKTTVGAGKIGSTSGSVVVSVSQASHNLSQGDFVLFTSVSDGSGGTIGGLSLNNKNFPVSLVDINKFIVDASSTATGTDTGIGTLNILLPVGTSSAIQGLGYGAGVYNAASAGTPGYTSVAFSNAFSVVGSNTNVSVAETGHSHIVGNFVEFSDATTIGGNVVLSSTAQGGPIFQITSIQTNAFSFTLSSIANATSAATGTATGFFLPVSITTTLGYRAWNEQADQSGITFEISQWSLDNWGEDILANRRGNGIYYYNVDASSTPQRATIVSANDAPTNVRSILLGDKRQLIAFGCSVYGGDYSPMNVRWSDSENFNQWTPSATNTSGDVPLTDGTEIVGAVRSRNAINVWTDNSLWLMTFIGGNDVFSFKQMGTNCGLIAPHASVDFDGRTFWMGEDNFYAFDGQVRNLDCTVKRYIFDRINKTNKDKIYAGINSEFKEIVWLYPSTGQNECDSYVIFNPVENYWVYGSGFWTTYSDKSVFNNTITTGTSTAGNSYLYNNEPVSIYTGTNNTALTSYLESATFEIDDGSRIMFMDRMIPDFTMDNSGTLQFSITTKQYPANTSITKGPFEITPTTKKVDLRARGREAAIRVSCDSVGTSWRYGSLRLAVQPDGMR
tara:strand:- start:28442 stop:30592 length:2151 start_codon:yes stop_codon:yes gene_type:complete